MAADLIGANKAPGTEPWRLRWGAIFGGTFVALGLWVLLYVFGLAVGLSTVDAGDGQFNFPALFTGIWAVVVPLIALFVGGLVAARTAGAQDRGSGTIHGLVLWGFTTLLGAFLIFSLASTLLAGVAGLGKSAASAAGQAPQAASALNIDTSQLLQPINQRLQAEGHPPLTAQELQAASRDAAQRAVQQGGINRQIIVDSLTANTKLAQEDVQQIAGDLEAQFQQTTGQLETTAAKAAETTGKAMWGVFFALLLGMISAIAGAAVGTSRKQERLANAQSREVITTDTVGTANKRGEVYP